MSDSIIGSIQPERPALRLSKHVFDHAAALDLVDPAVRLRFYEDVLHGIASALFDQDDVDFDPISMAVTALALSGVGPE